MFKRSTKVTFWLLTTLMLVLFVGCGGDDDNPTNPTDPGTTVTDIDGNVYKTVTIGNQEWMAENLKVTHYRNGDVIPNVIDDIEWSNLATGAYCAFNDDINNKSTYGLLYNWYAIADARNIAPEGWHIPTEAEWQELELALGMSQADLETIMNPRGTNEGSKMSGNESLWESGSLKNDTEFGSSGFDAIPGGECESIKNFRFLGFRAFYWALTDTGPYTAWLRALDCYEPDIDRVQYNKRYGLSVRCVKD